MVGAIGIEPTTPTVSRWCSAAELRAIKVVCKWYYSRFLRASIKFLNPSQKNSFLSVAPCLLEESRENLGLVSFMRLIGKKRGGSMQIHRSVVCVFILLLGGVLGSLTPQSAQARDRHKTKELRHTEPPLFYIEPYWHPSGPTADRFTLSWEYFLQEDAPRVIREKTQVQIYRKGQPWKRIPLVYRDGLLHAEFPSTCGERALLEFQLPFEDQKRTVPTSLCPRELGRTPEAAARFVFLSDTQEFPRQTEKTLQLLKKSDARLVLNGGDLVQTGSQDIEWQGYFDSFRDYAKSHVVIPIVGNHEYRYDADASLWEKYFSGNVSEWFFDFFVGDTQVIVFNSSFEDDPLLVSVQRAWMEGTLKKSSRYKIVAMHHPPYSAGIAHSDLAWKKEHLILQQSFVPLFERYGVDLVLSGHTHLFERSFKDAVHYLVSGAAGGKMGWLGAFNPYGIFARAIRTLTEVEITPTALKVHTWNDQGETEDEFRIP